MNSTNTTHSRPALALLASVALSMAALLSGCNPTTESASTDAQEGKFPTVQDMQGWRERRDGMQWQTTAFNVTDLKCRNLTDADKAKTPAGVKGYEQKYQVSVACSYTLGYERAHRNNASRTESLKRKVVGEEWYIARVPGKEHNEWHSNSMGVPGQDVN